MIGNDAHYTLVGFKEMCTATPMNAPVVAGLPTFSIRDLVADDLIVKAKEGKFSGKTEKPVEEGTTSLSAENVPLISLDKCLNGEVPLVGNCESPSILQAVASPCTHSTDSSTNGLRPPRVKRRYFQHTVKPFPADPEIATPADDLPRAKDPQVSRDVVSTKCTSPQKRPSENHVKSPTVDPESPSLSATSLATMTLAIGRKREPKSENGTRRMFPSSCAMDMDIRKYGGVIDDLTAAFVDAAITTSKGCGDKTSGEMLQRKCNGVRTQS